MDLSYIDVGIRLGAAALAGGMIGINRDLADRPMGTRTLGLVALGAAAVAVATIQVAGVAENPDAMSRVVQGIIQGVIGRNRLHRRGRNPAGCADAHRRRSHHGRHGLGHRCARHRLRARPLGCRADRDGNRTIAAGGRSLDR